MDLYMPKVDASTDHSAAFAQARRQAEDAKRQGNSVMIVTPGRAIIELPCSPKENKEDTARRVPTLRGVRRTYLLETGLPIRRTASISFQLPVMLWSR